MVALRRAPAGKLGVRRLIMDVEGVDDRFNNFPGVFTRNVVYPEGLG